MSNDALPPVPVIGEKSSTPGIVPNEPPHPSPNSLTKEDPLAFLTARRPATQPIPVPDANDAVLIGLLMDFERSKWLLEELVADHFHPLSAYRKLFDTILAIDKAGQKVGFPTLWDRLPVDGAFSRDWAAASMDEWRATYIKGVDLHSAVDSIKHNRKKNQIAELFKKGSNDLDTNKREPNVVAAEIANALLERQAGHDAVEAWLNDQALIEVH